MIIVFTGNGKGKTSAALGTALRSLGWKKKVVIIQFIKGNKEIGEWKSAKENNIDMFQFYEEEKYNIGVPGEKYREGCQRAWEFVKDIIKKKKYDLIILDEIINAMFYKLVDEKEVIDFLKKANVKGGAPKGLDIVLTGRGASEKLVKIADIATDMKELKHSFKQGIPAKKGIDY